MLAPLPLNEDVYSDNQEENLEDAKHIRDPEQDDQKGSEGQIILDL